MKRDIGIFLLISLALLLMVGGCTSSTQLTERQKWIIADMAYKTTVKNLTVAFKANPPSKETLDQAKAWEQVAYNGLMEWRAAVDANYSPANPVGQAKLASTRNQFESGYGKLMDLGTSPAPQANTLDATLTQFEAHTSAIRPAPTPATCPKGDYQ